MNAQNVFIFCLVKTISPYRDLINYSDVISDETKITERDLYQLRTNTIIDIKKLKQRIRNVDSFGRDREDPYYEGVKQFEDTEHPSKDNDTIEKQLEEIFGEDFFESKKYLLFIIFSIVIFLLLLCCCGLYCRWMCKLLKKRSNNSPIALQTFTLANPIYQAPNLQESYSFLPKNPLYSDFEQGPPDYSSLQGRKLYPGML